MAAASSVEILSSIEATADGHCLHAIARALHDAGGRAILVGGAVRDGLLGETLKDLDVEVFGLGVFARMLREGEVDPLRDKGPIAAAIEINTILEELCPRN